ncbi:MAG: DUF2087 domain-containing protein [Elusimicrobiota bacterium]|jgi:excisionase family DNA binding protein
MKSEIRDLKLLTAAEVAEILRMNTQVVLRKLQSGEIKAYKLGKDWRVEEASVREWLERHSNRLSDQDRVLQSFFSADGRLVSIPAKRGKRLLVLERLASNFLQGRVYTEAEVNDTLRRFHEDVCTLRREFIINKLMVRKNGLYRRCSSGPA